MRRRFKLIERFVVLSIGAVLIAMPSFSVLAARRSWPEPIFRQEGPRAGGASERMWSLVALARIQRLSLPVVVGQINVAAAGSRQLNQVGVDSALAASSDAVSCKWIDDEACAESAERPELGAVP